MQKNKTTIAIAFLFTALILGIGYAAFGPWTALIFTAGFLGGFLLWVLIPEQPPFKSFKLAFWVTLGLFILHRVEEKVMKFFDQLSAITGTATPEITSVTVILLVALSVGAWIAIPILTKRNYAFGYYLAWTFFASMGITELAHFIFPLFIDKPYSYFPGMASVILLAPMAWWGMYKLSQCITVTPKS